MSDNELTPNETVIDEDSGELRFKRGSVYAALLPLAFVTGLAAGYIFWGRDQAPLPADVAQAPVEAPVEAPAQVDLRAAQGQVRLDVESDDDPALGPEDAPITIIEFSDYRCPYCQRFRIETLDALLQAYPDQIRFIYRDFPVVGGFEAAVASECADEQDEFWAYHDLLFSGEIPEHTTATYLAYAERLSLDLDAFEQCLSEETIASEVEADAVYAAGLGVTGTPTFFINGIPLVGAQPLDIFAQIIDAELGS